jgi:hypothetical protein
VARFREFFTERVIDVHPSFEQGEPGEIVLARTIEFDGVVYFWGDIKAFPGAKREAIESMSSTSSSSWRTTCRSPRNYTSVL